MLLQFIGFIFKLIILGFAAFGLYIFITVLRMAYISAKIERLKNGMQTPEQMKKNLMDFAEKHNSKRQ